MFTKNIHHLMLLTICEISPFEKLKWAIRENFCLNNNPAIQYVTKLVYKSISSLQCFNIM